MSSSSTEAFHGNGQTQTAGTTPFVATSNLAQSAAHPFYAKLNEVLAGWKFDQFVEKRCAKFYAEKIGHPSLAPRLIEKATLPSARLAA